MNNLEEFIAKIDSEDIDIENYYDINKGFLDLKTQYGEAGLASLEHQAYLEQMIFAFSKSFEPDVETGRPKGISEKFGTMYQFPDGSRKFEGWPNHETLTPEDFEYIETRYKATTNLYAKSEYGLILYFLKPSQFSKHTDFKRELCKVLLDLSETYKLKALNSDDRSHYTNIMFETCVKSLNISMGSKFNDLISSQAHWLENLIDWDITREDIFTIAFRLTNIVSDFFKELKSHININKLLETNVQILDSRAMKNIWNQISILECSMELDNKSEINLINYKSRIAGLFEQLADENDRPGRMLAAIEFVVRALRLYRESNDREGISRLETRYQEIRGKGEFSTIHRKFPEDITREVMTEIEEKISRDNPLDIVIALAHHKVIRNIDLIKEEAEKSFSNRMEFSPIFSNWIVDKFGNTSARYITEEEKKLYAFWHTYSSFYQIGMQFLLHAFWFAWTNKKLDYNSILEFLEDSWMNDPIGDLENGFEVEVRPIDALRQPLKLFFDDLEKWRLDNNYQINYVVILDSLVLKVEYLLRLMCQAIGIPTFKMKTGGVIMEKLFDETLADLKDTDENPTGILEDDRIFLKYVLSEKAGLNLRNSIAHGLLNVHEYYFENIVIVLSAILRLKKYTIKYEQ